MHYQDIFVRLWAEYIGKNPAAKRIYDLLTARGETVINDHIALRTFNDPRVGVEVLAKPFIAAGYKECGEYEFKVKKLAAKHYEHPDANAPKVFISELKLAEFSQELQSKVQSALGQLDQELLISPDLLFSGRPWQPIAYADYQKLLTESEYAAWLLAYGFCANHFTVNVNELKTLAGLEELNAFLEAEGYVLNSSGGKIKGTKEQLLQQSSTMAEKTLVQFSDGKYEVPACYYEFAKRYPKADGKLYSGFIAASADKIFESTNVSS